MNRSISWGSILVAVAFVALLVQAYRMSPPGWFGLGLKVICGALIVLVIALFGWNTAIMFMRPK